MQPTQGGKGSSEAKKVQQILTSKYVMGILNWFKILKNKKIHEAILEIAVNTHSPFCPKLADYSACVPPALQNGFVNSFDFDNFELHKHSYTQFWSQTLLDFFSLWVTLASLGVPVALFFHLWRVVSCRIGQVKFILHKSWTVQPNYQQWRQKSMARL